ncbi:MAG: NlpC/P60 family protein [Acidimicrobiales bacterium]
MGTLVGLTVLIATLGLMPAGDALASASGGHAQVPPACSNIPALASGTSGGSISETQSEINEIEQRITAEQDCVSDLSEQYDTATYRLSRLDASIASNTKALDVSEQKVGSTRSLLQSAVLNSYMYDESAQQFDELFEGPGDTAALQNAYTSDALGNVVSDLKAFRGATDELEKTHALLVSERTEASEAVTAARVAESQATQATDAAESTLSQIKGSLARQVAAQAAAQAAQAAAQAQAAANLAAKQAAALKAEQAAQVAETLGDGSAAASSANKASSSAGEHTSSPPPSPGTNTAGEEALQAAESYLGVPYQWGGASRAGVDCSGLVMLAWEAAGVDLAHSAAIQSEESTPVSISDLEPGDLLFYDLDGTGIDHVVMYVGSGPFGTDTIIQAAHTGTVVSFDPIWYQGLVGAGQP